MINGNLNIKAEVVEHTTEDDKAQIILSYKKSSCSTYLRLSEITDTELKNEIAEFTNNVCFAFVSPANVEFINIETLETKTNLRNNELNSKFAINKFFDLDDFKVIAALTALKVQMNSLNWHGKLEIIK